MLGKIEGRRRGWMTEDEMVGRHHRLDGPRFVQAPGVGDAEGPDVGRPDMLQSIGSQRIGHN